MLCPGVDTSFGHDIRRSFESWCADAGREPIVHEVPFALQPEYISKPPRTCCPRGAPPDAIVSVPDGGTASALPEVL